ncbi:hypothetical protein, partial [Streptomyces sp. NPDC050164]|uniref:hypothetical protein n=1 Tax=Streptomyces sp. NPDC050164 TaxID=3365605 RepID=UPI00379E43F3
MPQDEYLALTGRQLLERVDQQALVVVEESGALGSVVWIMPQTRGLARTSAALSSVADSPKLSTSL